MPSLPATAWTLFTIAREERQNENVYIFISFLPLSVIPREHPLFPPVLLPLSRQ